jgi:hypothetical protein
MDHRCSILAAAMLLAASLMPGDSAGQPRTPAATTPPSTSAGKAPPAATAGGQTVLDSFNPQSVSNGPTAATVFTLIVPAVITQIQTYHWNGGKGAKPGTLALRDQNGRFYGPWPAKGEPGGKDATPNALWTVSPNVTLPAGTYAVVDSDLSTWSTNLIAGNRGFARVLGRPAK